MQESIVVYLIKRYLWEFILGAICLTMLQNAIENVGGVNQWTKLAKAIVNGLYASAFFAGIGGFYFQEIGIVGGIMVGTAVGLAGVKEITDIFFDILRDKLNQKAKK